MNRLVSSAGRLPSLLSAALALVALSGAPSRGQTGVVVGMVYDSTRAVPLQGARVAVMGTSLLVETDSLGQFRMDSVPEGHQVVVFFHARLGELGVSGSPGRVQVGEGVVQETYLAIPSHATILSAFCAAESGEGSVSLGGAVADAVTGVSLPGATVQVRGPPSGLRGEEPIIAETRADDSGWYQLCNLAPPRNSWVYIRFGGNDALPFPMHQSGAVVRNEKISISEPVTITGTVTDYITSQPLSGVSVELAGTSFAAVTDSLGRFGFARVPPGMQIIRTSQLGYAPRIDSLTAFSREALGLEIQLSTRPIAMEALVVTGRGRERPLGISAGERFYGLTELQVDSIANRVFDFAGLTRAARIPGLSVVEKPMANAFGSVTMGLCVELSRGRIGADPNVCNMVEVRINDGPVPDAAFFLLNLNPRDIKHFRLLTPLEAGMMYGDRGDNGVLLLYTR